ncbi:MAG: AmmeMemoRadiSam system protein A [Thermoplasmataceae archaeon]
MPEIAGLAEFPLQLDEADRKRILHAVKEAVESFVIDRIKRKDLFDWLPKIPCGTFVTITKNRMLRGCIGFPEAHYQIGEALLLSAIYAATEDPRFPEVTADELKDLQYEVTILGKPVQFDPKMVSSEISIGTHGLIVERGYHRGLLLPQVAVEYSMGPLEFLEAACEKAGLPGGSWKLSGTKVYKFPGYSFSDSPS